MKKIIITCMLFILLICGYATNCFAINVGVRVLPKEAGYIASSVVGDIISSEEVGDDLSFGVGQLSNPSDELKSQIAEYVTEDDEVVFVGLYAYNENDERVHISTENDMEVTFSKVLPGGAAGSFKQWGKDYRVIRIDDNTCTPMEVVGREETYSVTIKTKELGLFAIIYNMYAYSTEFYTEYGHDEHGEDIGDLLYSAENIKFCTTAADLGIDIPKKEGYTFVRWFNGPTLYEDESVVGTYWGVWQKNEEYVPLSVRVSSKEGITKGCEDGKIIEVSVSEGEFSQAPEIYLWQIRGCEGVTVESVTKIDPQTVSITLSGNSSNEEDEKLSVSFYHNALWDNEHVQLTPNGTACAMLTTDNELTIQSYPYEIEAIKVRNTDNEYINAVPEHEDFTVVVDVNKLREYESAAYVSIAVYDTEGKFLYMDSLETDMEVNSESSFEFSVPAQSEGIGSIKAYVWKDLNSMEPAANARSIY